AFGVGALLAIGVYILRTRLAETVSFNNLAKERRDSSVVGLWRQHPREFLIVAAISGGGSCAFYAYTTYMQKFLTNTSGFSRAADTEIMTIALAVFMLVQLLWGVAAH